MRRSLSALALAALLGGCGAPAQNAFAVAPNAFGHFRTLPAASWMDPGASRDDLIYVSNADGEVTVYDYATHSLVGVLADFDTPTGECVDTRGDVYIVDSAEKKIDEYVHGGTKEIRTLNDSPYTPSACSIDPATGNLAVANAQAGSKTGNISVYAHAAGKPARYTDPSISTFSACAYDDEHDLLAAGIEGSSSPAQFAWLTKRVGKLVNVKVPGPTSGWEWNVTGIQWDGRFFALDDGYVFQIALFDGQAYYVGETQFDAGYFGNQQYGIYDPNPKRQGTQILVGYDEQSYTSGVYYFPYPAGGAPDASFSHGVDKPYAIVISLEK